MTTVFIDKDGTLIEDIPYNVDPDRIRLMPDAIPALSRLVAAGCRLVVVTNQSGVARGLFDESRLEAVRVRIAEELAAEGVPLSGFYHCPHLPEGQVHEYAVACECRKPGDGLLRRAAADLGIDLHRAWMVGDILDDVEAGNRAGCTTILVDRASETEWRDGPWRRPDVVAPDLVAAATAILLDIQRRGDAAARIEASR